MINIPPIKPSTSIKTELLPDISPTWKVNQIVNATVESGGEALSKVLLRVGRHLLNAQTPVALKTGDPVQLLVKTLGETPLLNIQTPASQSSLATDKLRLFIAQQQSLTTFLEVTQKLITDNNLPSAVKTLISQFIGSIPSREQLLQPARLKQFIQNTGIFLEPKLAAQNTASLHMDTKAQLIKISHILQTEQMSQHSSMTSKEVSNVISQFVRGDISVKQLSQQLSLLLTKDQLISLGNHLKAIHLQPVSLPKSDSLSNLNQLFSVLHKHIQSKQLAESILNTLKSLAATNELKIAVDNALSAITSHQLTPLTREADNVLLLLFGLFIKDKDQINLINFKIEQQSNNNSENEEDWTVTLNFQFKTVGKIQAKVHLLNTQISTVFTAENTTTVKLINDNIELLNSAFKKLGFNNINIDVLKNKIIEAVNKPENIHILDEQA